MTAVWWVALVGAVWTLLALAAGVWIGRVIRERNRQIPDRDDR